MTMRATTKGAKMIRIGYRTNRKITPTRMIRPITDQASRPHLEVLATNGFDRKGSRFFSIRVPAYGHRPAAGRPLYGLGVTPAKSVPSTMVTCTSVGHVPGAGRTWAAGKKCRCTYWASGREDR